MSFRRSTAPMLSFNKGAVLVFLTCISFAVSSEVSRRDKHTSRRGEDVHKISRTLLQNNLQECGEADARYYCNCQLVSGREAAERLSQDFSGLLPCERVCGDELLGPCRQQELPSCAQGETFVCVRNRCAVAIEASFVQEIKSENCQVMAEQQLWDCGGKFSVDFSTYESVLGGNCLSICTENMLSCVFPARISSFVVSSEENSVPDIESPPPNDAEQEASSGSSQLATDSSQQSSSGAQNDSGVIRLEETGDGEVRAFTINSSEDMDAPSVQSSNSDSVVEDNGTALASLCSTNSSSALSNCEPATTNGSTSVGGGPKGEKYVISKGGPVVQVVLSRDGGEGPSNSSVGAPEELPSDLSDNSSTSVDGNSTSDPDPPSYQIMGALIAISRGDKKGPRKNVTNSDRTSKTKKRTAAQRKDHTDKVVRDRDPETDDESGLGDTSPGTRLPIVAREDIESGSVKPVKALSGLTTRTHGASNEDVNDLGDRAITVGLPVHSQEATPVGSEPEEDSGKGSPTAQKDPSSEPDRDGKQHSEGPAKQSEAAVEAKPAGRPKPSVKRKQVAKPEPAGEETSAVKPKRVAKPEPAGEEASVVKPKQKAKSRPAKQLEPVTISVLEGQENKRREVGKDEEDQTDETWPSKTGSKKLSYDVFVGMLGPCSQTCHDSLAERTAFCRSSLGTLAPRIKCGELPEDNVTLTEKCKTDDCDRKDFHYVLGIWGKCDRQCGGGFRFRNAKCTKTSDGTSVTKKNQEKFCGELPRELVQQECNTAPCKLYQYTVKPWGECSRECDGGTQTRRVECLDASQSKPVDESLCNQVNVWRPATRKVCNMVPCDDMPNGSRRSLKMSLIGHPGCENSTCSECAGGNCKDDEPSCESGILDATGICCESGKLSVDGICCPSDTGRLDSHGLCCSERVDICGQCGGTGLYVDVLGQCCSTVLDSGGVCCHSGRLDRCGVCNGDDSSCLMTIEANVRLQEPLSARDIERCLASKLSDSIPSFKAFTLRLFSEDVKEKGKVVTGLSISGLPMSYYTIKEALLSDKEDSNTAKEACAVRGMKPLNALPICGNSVCEFGELIGIPDPGELLGYQCQKDCPQKFTVCPYAAKHSSVSRDGPCGMNGICMFGSGGICDCFPGYTGTACENCEEGWIEIEGACFPKYVLDLRQNLGLGTQSLTTKKDDGRSKFNLRSVLISVTAMVISLVIILLALGYGTFIYKRKQTRKRTPMAPDTSLEDIEATSSSRSVPGNALWGNHVKPAGQRNADSWSSAPTSSRDEEEVVVPAGSRGTPVEIPQGAMSNARAFGSHRSRSSATHRNNSSGSWITAYSQGQTPRTDYYDAQDTFMSSGSLRSLSMRTVGVPE